MRPLRIEIEGFTAFRQRTCLDFSRLDLFAITGPTGAGKSSLIDAVCYALYGRVPRVNNEVGVCISLGLDRMQVTLEFEAGGRCFRVLRETRRRGAGNVRLEQRSGNEWQPLADRARDVNQKVEDIVGLDFEAFIRSVLLPQGQFQEFLAGSPERRREVLDRLLRLDVYKRMQTRAGQEAQVLQGEARAIEQRLTGELAEATPETLKRRKEELAAVTQEALTLEKRLATLSRGAELARGLATARQTLEAKTAAHEQAQDRLEMVSATVARGDQSLASLRCELEEVQRALAGNCYDDQFFAGLTLAANLAVNVDKMEKAVAEGKARLAVLEKNRSESAAAAAAGARRHEEARLELDAATSAYEEERRHDLAAALQAGLKPGDECPVCGGRVGVFEAVPSNLNAAREAMEAWHRKEEGLRAAAQSVSTAAAVAETQVTNAGEKLDEQESLLTEARKELAGTLPEGMPPALSPIQQALGAQRTAREERLSLLKRETELTGQLKQGQDEIQTARDDLTRIKAECAAAVVGMNEARTRVDAALAETRDLALREGLEEWTAALDGGKDLLDCIEAEQKESSSRHSELLTAKGRLEAQLQALERDIATAKALLQEQAQKKAQLDVTAELAMMLRADRFQAYLQAEALRTLAQEGSRRLLELSGSRYELEMATGGQDFVVKDRWNSDETRSVRSLSGGETFLASLALALALAESLPTLAASRRVVLDSIFLDEGFGSLDPEALDRAADALDALRGENRMVCVVTHLQDLAQRLPARVVVTKSESGSSVSVA